MEKKTNPPTTEGTARVPGSLSTQNWAIFFRVANFAPESYYGSLMVAARVQAASKEFLFLQVPKSGFPCEEWGRPEGWPESFLPIGEHKTWLESL